MSEYETEMQEYADTWDEAKVGGRSELPEGPYQAKIKVARVERSNFDDSWQFFVVFEDTGGAGEQPMWYNLQHEVGAALAKRVSRDLGWEEAEEAGALLKLKAVAESGFFLDRIVEIRVKDKPGEDRVFKQVFINKLLGVGEPSGERPPDDDDIPF